MHLIICIAVGVALAPFVYEFLRSQAFVKLVAYSFVTAVGIGAFILAALLVVAVKENWRSATTARPSTDYSDIATQVTPAPSQDYSKISTLVTPAPLWDGTARRAAEPVGVATITPKATKWADWDAELARSEVRGFNNTNRLR